MPDFIVTTKLEKVPTGKPIIMIDGTVPGWKPKADDYHFDHHKEGGADIQIDEIGLDMWQLMKLETYKGNYAYVTTQLDADAICAAAFIETYYRIDYEDLLILKAISYDCDHLKVPPRLRHLADKAAQAVAAMKQSGEDMIKELGWNRDKTTWSNEQKENFYNASFAYCVKWLVGAIDGYNPYPGELGEATPYWEKVNYHKGLILSCNLIRHYRGCTIFDLRAIKDYVDPRSCLAALELYEVKPTYPITVTWRTKGKGYRYTIADTSTYGDLTKGSLKALTELDKALNPSFDSWGGRKTVAGSSWNGYSLLEPHQVIDVILEHNHKV